MKKLIVILLCLALCSAVGAQSAVSNYFERGTNTLRLGGSTVLRTGGTFGITAVNAAGAGANPFDFTGTLGIMDGSDTFQLLDINLTNANHTGSSNTVEVMNIANITGDAQADEVGINIGSGWDYSLKTLSPIYAAGTTSGGIAISPIATGTAITTIANQNISAATITLPSATCTLPGLGLANIWAANQELDSGFTVDDTAFAVADTTGVVTLLGGATIDNNADAAILNLTETTVRATGILDVTGNSTLASVDVGGGSGGSGATISTAGLLTVDGAAALNGGITVDTSAFAVADTTGVVTLLGGATIDNNADAAILNLTETTVRATGILDVTGNATFGGGYGSTGATISSAGVISADGVMVNSAGVGAAAATGNVATEYGNGVLHKTVLTFTNVDVVLADAAGVVAYGGTKVYDMPAGAVLMLGAVADIDLTKSSAGVNADWDGDVGIGTITASNDGTLAATEQNIIPTTATPQAVAGVTTANGQSTATENAVIDGTSAAADVYVNLLVDDADHDVTGTPCNLILNGTLTLHWINLGDY